MVIRVSLISCLKICNIRTVDFDAEELDIFWQKDIKQSGFEINFYVHLPPDRLLLFFWLVSEANQAVRRLVLTSNPVNDR